jgi:hypothetical protein
MALAAGTPFFLAQGELSRLLRFVSGERIMPAELWAPLFDRPDLVLAASHPIVGESRHGADVVGEQDATLASRPLEHRGIVCSDEPGGRYRASIEIGNPSQQRS